MRFFADFGPLHLGRTYRFCRILEAHLRNPRLAGKRIVQCASQGVVTAFTDRLWCIAV